jgi:PAS domain-containing protein
VVFFTLLPFRCGRIRVRGESQQGNCARTSAEIERQRDARREAGEQLRSLIESSTAAMVTADADGSVLMANEAAHPNNWISSQSE